MLCVKFKNGKTGTGVTRNQSDVNVQNTSYPTIGGQHCGYACISNPVGLEVLSFLDSGDEADNELELDTTDEVADTDNVNGWFDPNSNSS